MSATVYYADLHVKDATDNRLAKISRLCQAVGLAALVQPKKRGGADELVAVKAHFGERGNDTYLHPTFARQVIDLIKEAGGKPFLTDTCTLYNGMRHNAVDHLETAYLHGFTPYVVNAPVVIADGIIGMSEELVPVDLKHFKEVHIARAFREASAMVVLSHFKGHQMGGFGGAIKNLAMGCASYAGKIDQHGRNVVIYEEACIGCGLCLDSCRQEAISLKKVEEGKTKGKAKGKKKAKISKKKCIGCYECMTVCKQKAIGVEQPDEHSAFVERMTEYAYGAVQGKEGRVCYLNFVLNVTPQCDCAGWSDPALVPDLGILASVDPVALDTACFDLVKAAPGLVPLPGCGDHCAGVDKFAGLRPETRGFHQMEYAQSIGMGSMAYKLKKV
ncbi:MAG: DUF362 domain-containing protein [Desulfobulbaceae bacterium]|nr:DUF362 domain-containing protein [Desulfobulbaceae bacterium]